MRRTLILMLTVAPLLLGQMPVTRKPKAWKNPVTWIRHAVAAETALAERFSGWGAILRLGNEGRSKDETDSAQAEESTLKVECVESQSAALSLCGKALRANLRNGRSHGRVRPGSPGHARFRSHRREAGLV